MSGRKHLRLALTFWLAVSQQARDSHSSSRSAQPIITRSRACILFVPDVSACVYCS